MCGIVALIRNKGKVDNDICVAFEQMWWGTQLRGINGSGIMQIPVTGNKIRIDKSAFTPDYACFEKGISEILKLTDVSVATVAHCRQATKLPQKVDDKWLKLNAHPFQSKHISLVHNGYFTYVGKDHHDTHEVDSASFANAVADLGIDEALKQAYGAYALVFFDNKEKTINVVRNADRPLYRVEHEFGHFFISEPELAVWILKRNKLKDATKITSIDPETLYTYKVDDLIDNNEVSYTERKINRRVYFPPTTSSYDSSRYSIVNQQKNRLTLDEVMELIGRYEWDDCAWIARNRISPAGWQPRMSDDYAEIMAQASDSNSLPFEPSKNIGLKLSEIEKSGLIYEIFHKPSNFSLKRGMEYEFKVNEVHLHKTFCSIVGEPMEESMKNTVRIYGNYSGKEAEFENKRNLVGKVLHINKTRSRKGLSYNVQMGELRFQEPKTETPNAVLLISKKDKTDEEIIDLNSLKVCPGCNEIVPTADIQPFQDKMMLEVESKPGAEVTITLNVCSTCRDACKADFKKYYNNKYKPTQKSLFH